ncbi:MAG: S-layer homology domain-containing protein [Clostridia bacterium]|nr:S-layer homology domain-containing protein [Clostridia bacterium]
MAQTAMAFPLAVLAVLWYACWPAGVAATPLRDMEGHWADRYVAALVAAGVMRGFPDGRFRAETPLSRAEAAALMSSLLDDAEADLQVVRGFAPPFADVEATAWYAPAVIVAWERGLMMGDPDGRFRPDRALTRAELAVLVLRLDRLLVQGAGATASVSGALGALPYGDRSSVPVWAREAVGVLTRLGVLEGGADGRFEPARSVTRAEAAAVVARYLATVGRLYSLRGRVEGVDTVTLRLKLRSATARYDLALQPAADVFAGGRRLTLSALRPGDEVDVVVDREGRAVYLALVPPEGAGP